MKTFIEWLGKDIYYHGASPEDRESIRVHGLRPSNPAEGDPYLHDEGEERKGVYVEDDIEGAMQWGGGDVWEVDATGLETGWFADSSHTYIKSDVPPSRLRLLVADGERVI